MIAIACGLPTADYNAGMPLALGVDAGGTSTRAVLIDSDREVWSAVGPSANISTGDIVVLKRLLADCPTPDSACAAIAGLVSLDQKNKAESLLETIFPRARVTAVPDFEAALEACEPPANVCVIAGTGSIVCSRVDGEVKRTGGRGFVLGDEGSGFQFGRDAFLEFLETSDEGVSDALATAVQDAFGTQTRSEAIAELYRAGDIGGRLASLAPALAADAEAGAIYALKSLRINMAKLAHICRQHIRRYGHEHPKIGCQGGLWTSGVYRQAFVDAVPLWCEMPAEDVLFDLPPPVHGAAAIAQKLLAL
jgi:N-acetylglucosamine kinase-like BadF-type ATPase